MIKLQAHRGVSTEYPENTMPAFRAAVDQGYEYIELDVRVTSDLKPVVIHDSTINRTARRADGGIVGAALPVAEQTYEQLLQYDFGIGYHVKFKGTKLPLLEDVLNLAREAGVKVKIDAKYRTLRPAHKEAVLSLLEGYTDVVELTVNDLEALNEAQDRFPTVPLHYGRVWDLQTIRDAAAAARSRLTFWLPYQNQHTDDVPVPYLTEELAAEAKKYGDLAVWMLTKKAELEAVEALGATLVETSGGLKHEMRKGTVTDMHVHTEHSHDARTPLEQMVRGGIANGVNVIAIADHCDTTRCEESIDADIYTNIQDAFAEAERVSGILGDECLILKSVELGDGIWYPEQSNKVAQQLPYDVIVGATHAVRCAAVEKAIGTPRWFSQINFLELPEDQFDELMNNYFDDMLTMVQTQNIDIMAHITCAAGYYPGRHGIYKDLRPYTKKIRKILEAIISKGIAMEINGTLCDEVDGKLPYYWIVEMYYALGGYLITLSTDSHGPRTVGLGYEKRIPLLKKTGFTHIVYYKDRKSVPCSL